MWYWNLYSSRYGLEVMGGYETQGAAQQGIDRIRSVASILNDGIVRHCSEPYFLDEEAAQGRDDAVVETLKRWVDGELTTPQADKELESLGVSLPVPLDRLWAETRTKDSSQTHPAYCPSCRFFQQDCNPDPEDYDKPCDAFKLNRTGG